MKRIKSAPANIAEMVNRKKLNSENPTNSVMLDYLDNSKQEFNTNDEEVVIISILYYYICEKVFTKKNITEFILFLVQTFIKYLFTHHLHEIISHNELITNNLALLLHKI